MPVLCFPLLLLSPGVLSAFVLSMSSAKLPTIENCIVYRTSGIRTSRVPGGHPRHDNRGTGKRHYQEGTREQYRGKPDWTGGRTKEELFSGSDRWHQEKHYDLRW